jgi:alpha-beta hydrolase superfamily lysophospholipase
MNEELDPDEMRDCYDFSGGVRGKYAARYAEGVNIVRLDPDVAAVFPDDVSVNEALRALADIIRRQSGTAAKA